MTRGSNTPLVPPLEDPESSLHKKKDKNVKEDQTPKKDTLTRIQVSVLKHVGEENGRVEFIFKKQEQG